MKMKSQFIEAFKKQEIVKREDIDDGLFELEPSDFDKAIAILKEFRKKTGAREFELLKKAYISGGDCYVYTSPRMFVDYLRKVLTRRMSSVEVRNAQAAVEKEFNSEEIELVQTTYFRLSHLFYAYLNNDKELELRIDFWKSQNALEKKLLNAINNWIEEEVLENENSLEKLTSNDWNDIKHILDCFEDQHTEQYKQFLVATKNPVLGASRNL